MYFRTANAQFIQDRIRHLVDAFSTRAQAARERIETPATPSSISSRETVEHQQHSIPMKHKLSISFSDRYIEEKDTKFLSSKKGLIRYFGKSTLIHFYLVISL